jgi:hypothetical protein
MFYRELPLPKEQWKNRRPHQTDTTRDSDVNGSGDWNRGPRHRKVLCYRKFSARCVRRLLMEQKPQRKKKKLKIARKLCCHRRLSSQHRDG